MHLTFGSLARASAAGLAVLLVSAGGVSPARATYEQGEPEVTWGVQIATPDTETYSDVEVAGDEVWAIGSFNSDGELQPVVARYDRDGHLLERTIFADGGAYNTTNLALTAGDWGAVVAGAVNGNAFVTRYRPDGTVVWTTDLPGDGAAFASVVVDGTTVVTGGTVNGQFGDWRVESFDLATGASLLTRTIDAAYGSLGAVAVADGRIIVGGLTMGEVVPGERAGGDYDAVLMALDPSDLSTTWVHQFGTPGNDWISALAVRDDTIYWGGNLGNEDDYPYGQMIGGLGAWSPEGTELWHEQLGPGYAPVRSLVATSEGLVLGGEVDQGGLGDEVKGYGGTDGYLQGRSFTGATLWTKLFGSDDYDEISGLATSGDDRIYAAGETGGVMFGTTDGDQWDAVLMALDVPHLQRPDLSVRVGKGGCAATTDMASRPRPSGSWFPGAPSAPSPSASRTTGW